MPRRTAIANDTKRERLEARLTPTQRKRIERAASIRGTSVSDFVVSSADDAARQIIEKEDVLTLGDQDRELFVRTLLDAPDPGPRLVAAAKRYKARMRGR